MKNQGDQAIMKITRISTQMMGVVIPRPPAPAGRRNWIFVRIETDEGITGLGEATTEYFEHAVVAAIEKHFAPFLIGRDPTQITRAWQEMRQYDFEHGYGHGALKEYVFFYEKQIDRSKAVVVNTGSNK